MMRTSHILMDLRHRGHQSAGADWETRQPRFAVAALITVAALTSGCQMIMEDLAREPYHDALRKGRVSPTEYMRISEQIDQAANPPPPSGRIPDKYK